MENELSEKLDMMSSKAMNLEGKVVLVNNPIKKNLNIYSNQLLTILQTMIEEDKSKRPSSSELCQMIRAQYIKTFLKTSSLCTVIVNMIGYIVIKCFINCLAVSIV